MEPRAGGFLAAHFYAPSKNLAGVRMSTLAGNVIMLWLMTVLLCAALHLEVLQKLGRLLPARMRG